MTACRDHMSNGAHGQQIYVFLWFTGLLASNSKYSNGQHRFIYKTNRDFPKKKVHFAYGLVVGGGGVGEFGGDGFDRPSGQRVLDMATGAYFL